MLPPPRSDLKANTLEYECLPLVKPTGFREYDARWLYEKEINEANNCPLPPEDDDEF